jgi:hypothetical protein
VTASPVILDPAVIEVMLREAVSGARSYVELSRCAKGLVERLRDKGVLVSLLDEDGESMIVYGGDGSGGAMSLCGYWGEFGATSNVVCNGRSFVVVEAGPPEFGESGAGGSDRCAGGKELISGA